MSLGLGLRHRTKEQTADLHRYVEQAQIMWKIVTGNITDGDYQEYLANIREIYHGITTNDHCPSCVRNLMQVTHYDQDIDQMNLSPVPANVAAQEYGKYVMDLPYERLLAHIYVRYMADIAGGQIIKKKLLQMDPGIPVHAYDIDPEAEDLINGLMTSLVSTYHDAFVAEAKVAFMYHAAVLR